MAATLTQERFTGPDWVFERKFDGIRLLTYKQSGDVRLFSRNRLPQHLPSIADAVARLPADELVLDGELAWDADGYHLFDILWIDGRNVTSVPLDERRAMLAALPLAPPLYLIDRIDHPEPWALACREGWEGVIAKRRESRYEHRRSPHWLKMKCEESRDFLVGGFTDPQGSRQGLGALLVGVRDGTDLVFSGKVGTGLDTAMLVSLRRRLNALEIDRPPFTKGTGLPRLRAHWVRPEIVVTVGFIEWTGHGKLRHPRLLGVKQ
jgi:ATP-dependent DNA ligase